MKTFKQAIFVVVAACLLIAALPAAAGNSQQEAKKLYVFNWVDYMSPDLVKAFEKEYGVKVVRDFYGTNEEMFAKLRAGGDKLYDVIFPSFYFVPRLIHTGLIQPLDHSEIPNIKNLFPMFRNPEYDPHNKYSVAYQWGDDGIAYNVKAFPDNPDSWALLFDPAVNSKYPFSIMTEAQVMIGAACAYQGHGYDCDTTDDWKQAAKLLLATKKRSNFSGFVDGLPGLAQLARGNTKMTVTFNGDYARAKKRDPKGLADTEFFVPKEGAELWVDTMAIPAHAPHPALAHKFINFVLRAKMSAMLSNYNMYSTPNEAAVPYLDDALSKPPVKPTEEEMERLHYLPLLKGKDLKTVNQLWSAIKS